MCADWIWGQPKTIVGLGNFHDRPDAVGMVEIGYSVLPTYRRQGFGREIAMTMWQFAASCPNVAVLRASVAPTNVPSLAIIESAGCVKVGEQEDPEAYMESSGKLAMKPKGLKERGVIWLSSGGSSPTFTPVVLQIDNPGWHDATLGDVDGDGDIDIVTKIWNKELSLIHISEPTRPY